MADRPDIYNKYGRDLGKRLLNDPNNQDLQKNLESMGLPKGILASVSNLRHVEQKITQATQAAEKLKQSVSSYQRLSTGELVRLKNQVREAENVAKVYRRYGSSIPKGLSDQLKTASFESRRARAEHYRQGYGAQLSLFGRTPTVRIEKRELESISGPLEDMVKRMRYANEHQLTLPLHPRAPSAYEDEDEDIGEGGGRGASKSRWHKHGFAALMRRHFPYTAGGATHTHRLLSNARDFLGTGALGALGLTAGIGALFSRGLIGFGEYYEGQHALLGGVHKYLGAAELQRQYQLNLSRIARVTGHTGAGIGSSFGYGVGRFAPGVPEARNAQQNALIGSQLGLPFHSATAAQKDIGALLSARSSRFMGGLDISSYYGMAREGRTLGLYQGGQLRNYMQRYYLPTIAKGVQQGIQNAQTMQAMTAGIQALAARGGAVQPGMVSSIRTMLQSSGVAGLRTVGATAGTVGSLAGAAQNAISNPFRFMALSRSFQHMGLHPGMSTKDLMGKLGKYGLTQHEATQLSNTSSAGSMYFLMQQMGLANRMMGPATYHMLKRMGLSSGDIAAFMGPALGLHGAAGATLAWNYAHPGSGGKTGPAGHSLTPTYTAGAKNLQTQYTKYQNLMLSQSGIVVKAFSNVATSAEHLATTFQNIAEGLSNGGLFHNMGKHNNQVWDSPKQMLENLAHPPTTSLGKALLNHLKDVPNF